MEFLQFIIDWFSWFATPKDPTTFSSVQHAWIGAAVGLASLAMNVYGQAKKAKADKELTKQNEGVNNRYKSLANYFEGESTKNYLDTDAAKSTIASLKDSYKNQISTAKDESVATGGTAESKVALQGKLQDSFNDSITKISGYGTQYKNNLKRDYAGMLSGLSSSNQQTYAPASNSWGNYLANTSQVSSNALASEDWNKMFKS